MSYSAYNTHEGYNKLNDNELGTNCQLFNDVVIYISAVMPIPEPSASFMIKTIAKLIIEHVCDDDHDAVWNLILFKSSNCLRF